MTERYLLPCVRCRNASVEVGPVLDDSVSCSRCGATQQASQYAAVHALVLRYRDRPKGAHGQLPCQDCGAFAVPYTEGADPMADIPCGACGRPQFLDDYEHELAAMKTWQAHLRARHTQALVKRFEAGVLCPSCKNRLHPSLEHAGAGVPCGRCGTFTPIEFWIDNVVEPDALPVEDAQEAPAKGGNTKLFIGCGCALALALGLGLVVIVLVVVL